MSMKKKASLKSKMAAVKGAPKRALKESSTKARASAKASKATKAAAKSAVALPSKAISQKQTKSQIYAEIAEIAQVSKHDAKNILAAIRNVVERHVKIKGSGEIVIPDLGIKVRRIQKKATKARMGRNPFTGEEIQIPAKAARKSVKVSAMKTLKAFIEE